MWNRRALKRSAPRDWDQRGQRPNMLPGQPPDGARHARAAETALYRLSDGLSNLRERQELLRGLLDPVPEHIHLPYGLGVGAQADEQPSVHRDDGDPQRVLLGDLGERVHVPDVRAEHVEVVCRDTHIRYVEG